MMMYMVSIPYSNYPTFNMQKRKETFMKFQFLIVTIQLNKRFESKLFAWYVSIPYSNYPTWSVMNYFKMESFNSL